MFLLAKTEMLPPQCDLVSTFHLLVCVLNVLLVHMPKRRLRFKFADKLMMPQQTQDGRVDTIASLATITQAVPSVLEPMVKKLDTVLLPIFEVGAHLSSEPYITCCAATWIFPSTPLNPPTHQSFKTGGNRIELGALLFQDAGLKPGKNPSEEQVEISCSYIPGLLDDSSARKEALMALEDAYCQANLKSGGIYDETVFLEPDRVNGNASPLRMTPRVSQWHMSKSR